MSFVKNRENRCDFMIVGNGDLVFVQVRKARRVISTLEEMEREFCEPVMRLRSSPHQVPSPGNSGRIPGTVSGGFSGLMIQLSWRFATTESR